MPDMPAGIPFPCNGTPDDEGKEDLLTFICQINLEELATNDTGKLLPASGMLYFFANLDYFLGDYEAEAECLGFWPDNAFKVMYAPEIKELCTHEVSIPMVLLHISRPRRYILKWCPTMQTGTSCLVFRFFRRWKMRLVEWCLSCNLMRMSVGDCVSMTWAI